MSSPPDQTTESPGVASAPASALTRFDTLWLHGAGLTGDTWDRITADCPLAVTPDLPGHGDAPLVVPPRFETYADALSGLVPPGAVVV